MKKIIAFVLTAVLSLPIFALSFKVGDSIDYLPTKEGKNIVSIVTKIAPAANGTYEFVLLANGVSYTYAVAEGEQVELFSKTTPKSKTLDSRELTVTSVKNNIIEFEPTANSNSSTVDAK